MLTSLSIGRYGRFGNALFQIAATIGIARKSGQAYGFPPFINWDHKERFGSTEDIELDKYFVNPLPRLMGDYPYFQKKEYPWGYHDIHLPTGNWDLVGHFQSEKYFKHRIDEVRHYFRMKVDPGEKEGVAIHVRLGDYDDHYHPRLKIDYYQKAMDQFPKGTKFTVFSDDLDTALKMFDLKWVGYCHSVDYITDFAMMKRFQHFITGNSSYSLMAAILSEAPNKKIVCPSNWFGPAWTVPMETRDIYPENAIIL